MIDFNYFLSYVKDDKELDSKCEKGIKVCYGVIEHYLMDVHSSKQFGCYDHRQLLMAYTECAEEVSVDTVRNSTASIKIENQADASVVEFEIEALSPEHVTVFLPLAIAYNEAHDRLELCSHLRLRFERCDERWHLERISVPFSDLVLTEEAGHFRVDHDADDLCLNAMIAEVYRKYFESLRHSITRVFGLQRGDLFVARLDAWIQDVMRVNDLEETSINNILRRTYEGRERAIKGGAIQGVCDGIADLLQEKQRKYGDAALNPIRVFSKADRLEQLKVRIDDKLSRLRNMQEDEDEDVIKDLTGYLVLYMVARSSSNEVSNRGESVDNEE